MMMEITLTNKNKKSTIELFQELNEKFIELKQMILTELGIYRLYDFLAYKMNKRKPM